MTETKNANEVAERVPKKSYFEWVNGIQTLVDDIQTKLWFRHVHEKLTNVRGQ